MNNKPGLIANYRAVGAIGVALFAKFATEDNLVTLATAGASVQGVTTGADVQDGDRVDLILTEIAPITYGAAVTRGQRLKSDATGRAIPALDAEASAGLAQVSGVAGDIGAILLGR
jgi:hypothetical protein